MPGFHGLERIKKLLNMNTLANSVFSILDLFFSLSFLFPLIKHLQIFLGCCSLGNACNYYHTGRIVELWSKSKKGAI